MVSYIYDGAGSPMQTTYNEPNLSLTYANGGLDRFGRVVNHSWMNGTDPLVHIIHSYDFAGNRTFRHDAVHAANSELYAYDQLNQIKSLNRGVLNQDRTAVTSPNHAEAWNFDKTGNWDSYNKNGVTETRTHNAANELQGIATHDANGNMTLMPGLKGKYDAWNRLVEVRDSSDNLISSYEYNGLNQRVKKTVGATVTKSFFNEKWQELESVTNSETTSFVWGLRYVDDLVLREKSEERLYSLADPNWNVVATADSTGAVTERMKYDAFGKVSWLDENFDTKTESDFDWNRTFTGQVLDAETGLMLYRNRYYHTGLGRFVSHDPIGYFVPISDDETDNKYDSRMGDSADDISGYNNENAHYRIEDINLYRYVKNSPNMRIDPSGLQSLIACLKSPAILRACIDTGCLSWGKLGSHFAGKGKELVKLLEKWGGNVVKGGKGSHTKVKMPNGTTVTVPQSPANGTVEAILKQATH